MTGGRGGWVVGRAFSLPTMPSKTKRVLDKCFIVISRFLKYLCV